MFQCICISVPQFDVETAITVCRQAAYHQHALYLAHRHKQHHHYLKILLDDLHAYSDGLEYIASLDFYDAERYVRDYGLRLMNASGAHTRSPVWSETERGNERRREMQRRTEPIN